MVDQKDPIPVEVVEPVKVSRVKALNGGLRLTIGYALLSLGIVLGLFFGFKNDQKLHDEVQARCQVGNDLRATLHAEHVPKKAEALHNLKRFPHGARLIVNGQPLFVSHKQLKQQYIIERNVVRETQQLPCP